MTDRVLRSIATKAMECSTEEPLINIEYFNPKKKAIHINIENIEGTFFEGERFNFTSVDELFTALYYSSSMKPNLDVLPYTKYKDDVFMFGCGTILKNERPIYLIRKDEDNNKVAYLDVSLLKSKDVISSFIVKKLIPKQIELSSVNFTIKAFDYSEDSKVDMYKTSSIEDILLNGIDSIFSNES